MISETRLGAVLLRCGSAKPIRPGYTVSFLTARAVALVDQGAQMPVKFVLFDAFGTLVRIPKATHPYRQILKEGIRQGRRPRPDDLHHIMARALSLSDAADHFGIKIPADRMAEIHGALEAELDSIEAFEDGIRAVDRLQAEGIKIAIASNLAAPYAEPVRRLYPTMDAYGCCR